jgi:hypothetical protein
MATFFKPSSLWVIDYRFDGRDRRWYKSFRSDVDTKAEAQDQLADLHGNRARLTEVRRATDNEERQYVRGEQPKTNFCPTGR